VKLLATLLRPSRTVAKGQRVILRVWFSCRSFVLSDCGVKMVATLEVFTKDERH
jgi:hypothetical protein